MNFDMPISELSKTYLIDGGGIPASNTLRIIMIYKCIKCGDNNITEITDGKRTAFYCENCRKKFGQAIQADGKIIIKTTNDGRIKHVSVGAIIEKNKEILLAKKRTYNYKYCTIAGHLEYRETPKNGVTREILEETGMKVEKLKLLFHGDLDNDPCRAGAEIHEWYFYQAFCSGEPVKNAEFEFINWYNREQIGKLDLGFAERQLFTKLAIIGGI